MASRYLTKNEIIAACAALVDAYPLVPLEEQLVRTADPASAELVAYVRTMMLDGEDILGESYMNQVDSKELRQGGEIYTPDSLVDWMLSLSTGKSKPARIVDAGCGSGRFAFAAAQAYPQAHIVAVDASPLATLMCKAKASVLGFEDRVSVLCGNFPTIDLPELGQGPTLWIGNPPYVRHHNLSKDDKRWLSAAADSLGVMASGLSGLHVYFIVSIAQRFSVGDYGILVTSAEWLDVGYGSVVRRLMVEVLGLEALYLADKKSSVFANADTTAVVSCFDFSHKGGFVGFYNGFSREGGARSVRAEILSEADRWSPFFSDTLEQAVSYGYVRLGDIARVHRGIVTGANKFWVRPAAALAEGLSESLSVPVVSHAREIMDESWQSVSDEQLARLIVLPQDVDSLDAAQAESARAVVAEGKSKNVDEGYVARSRKCWWSIPVGDPPPILMTYMARRPPVFVTNPKGIRPLNVVHGIYPSVELSDRALNGLVDYLNQFVSCESGRTYCGGLVKFEPREAEALLVPSPQMLEEDTWRTSGQGNGAGKNSSWQQNGQATSSQKVAEARA